MGDHKKPIEGGCQKRGAQTFCQFKGGGLPRQRGGVVYTLMQTMILFDPGTKHFLHIWFCGFKLEDMCIS